jgi:metal-sulfur cluster biosynthetic enzyme
MIDAASVREALRVVRDPELDESIVDLDFIASLRVDGAAVAVELRLPTYFCAPNFSYLMVEDARAAVLAVPGVEQAHVTLLDHFVAEEVTKGVDAGAGFAASFPGLADGELGSLRLLFRRKAYLSRQYRLCKRLRAEGRSDEELAALRLADVPPSEELDGYLESRREMGLDMEPTASLLIDAIGRQVSPADARHHLAQARSVSFSMQLNAEFCSGVLATRYPDARPIRQEEPV